MIVPEKTPKGLVLCDIQPTGETAYRLERNGSVTRLDKKRWITVPTEEIPPSVQSVIDALKKDKTNTIEVSYWIIISLMMLGVSISNMISWLTTGEWLEPKWWDAVGVIFFGSMLLMWCHKTTEQNREIIERLNRIESKRRIDG